MRSLPDLRWWLLLLAGSLGVTLAMTVVGIPSPALFAALLCAIALALAGRAPAAVPRPAQLGAQAVLGVYIGTMVQSHTLAALGSRGPAVVAVGLATLALSVLAGAALGRHRDTDQVTGSLSLVAGGASGLVAIARELGGEERTVAVIQYLRVVLVTATLPLVAAWYPHTPGGSGAVAAAGGPWWRGVLLTVVCVAAGIVIGRALRLPAGALLGPLVLSAAASLSGLADGATVPLPLVVAGYLAIGWQAGLGFTRDALRQIARLLPWAALLIVALGIGCAGLGIALSAMTGVSALEGYLATTPGGIYAVLAVAAGANVDVTFIVAAQMVRVLLMLFLAPWAARALQARRERRAGSRPARLRSDA